MKSIDVIIVSDGKSDELRFLTQNAILSARGEEHNCFVRVIVIEKQNVDYELAEVFRQEGEYCYNRFLNEGAAQGNSDYIAFCNNDLLFEEDWASKIIAEMELEGVRSACSFSPISNIKNNTGIEANTGNYFGYQIRKEFCGWMFVWKRTLWEQIKLDERINFWTSDNATAESLKENNEGHILVTKSIVHHVNNGSTTLNTIHPEKRKELTHDEIRKFNRIYNQNLFSLGKDIAGKVTVIVPVYGDINYWRPLLERASKSALNQKEKAQDVVINFGNNLYEARNSFINQIKTDFVIFLDADDELDECYIQEMLKIENADIIVPSVHRYYEDGRIDTDQYWYTPRPLITGNYIVIGAMIKTDLLRKLNGFKDMEALEDFEFFLRAEEVGARFAQCVKAIYKIHVRPGSRNRNQELAPKIIKEAKIRRGLI